MLALLRAPKILIMCLSIEIACIQNRQYGRPTCTCTKQVGTRTKRTILRLIGLHLVEGAKKFDHITPYQLHCYIVPMDTFAKYFSAMARSSISWNPGKLPPLPYMWTGIGNGTNGNSTVPSLGHRDIESHQFLMPGLTKTRPVQPSFRSQAQTEVIPFCVQNFKYFF